MNPTPCRKDPELWVGDNHADRKEAIRICRTECPAAEFAACARLAKVEPFGVMAGKDYNRPQSGSGKGRECAVCGVRNYSNTGHAPRTCEGCIETKTCEGCAETFTRGVNLSTSQWVKTRFCSIACGVRNRRKAAA